MRKILALAFLFAATLSASAADNTLLVTPCATGCITPRSKDVGAGVQAPMHVLSDTGGNALAMPTAGADAVSNTATGLQGYTYQFWFNGTTWDRARGDATNGAFVNVKTSVLPTGAATSANQSTEITALQAIQASAATTATNTGAAIPAGTANIGNVGQISQYPTTAVPYTASATGTTAATTATLTGAVSVTTYICGLSIRANATAAATGNATVTGTITGTLNFTQWTAPNASGLGVTEQIFSPCVPASAVNTSIAVVSAAPGTGGVVSVTAWGYKL